MKMYVLRSLDSNSIFDVKGVHHIARIARKRQFRLTAMCSNINNFCVAKKRRHAGQKSVMLRSTHIK